VLAVRFSPDGGRIVTGSYDNSARLWDAARGAEIAVLAGHLDEVHFVAFSPDGQRIFTLGGGQGIVWTRREAASLPADAAGLWFNDFGSAEEPLPPEITRVMCVATPIRINGDGLVVFFEGTDVDPPHAVLRMRCASDLTCQVYYGGPEQGLEAIGDGKITFSGKTGDLCLAGECRVIARCPELVWTDDERNSGFAERWEAVVLPSGK
jgi:hypothetical protein